MAGITVLTGAGVTATLQATTLANATAFLMMSLPSNTAGNPLLGSSNMANAMPVTIATDNATVTMNMGQILGAATVTSGAVAGLLAVGGAVASAAAVSGGPVLMGGRTQTGEIASTATGQAAFAAQDKVGKLINLPYANPENFTSGCVSTIVTTLVNIIASTNATNRFYITGLQLANLGATTTLVQLNDPSVSFFIAPGGSGNDVLFPVPLKFGLGSPVAASCSVAVSTVIINVQGFVGQ